jgi:hypothetical protein
MGFGLVPMRVDTPTPIPHMIPLPPQRGGPICPQLMQWIPPGCTAKIVTDPNGCTRRIPICPPTPSPLPPTRTLPPCPPNDPYGVNQGCGAGLNDPCPPCTPQTVPPILNVPPTPAPAPATTPEAAGCLTNQICVLPDGSQWIYSVSQGKWLSMGVPYNVGAPPTVTAAPGITTVPAPPPVSVSVTPPPAAPAASPYQSIIDFATQDSLISGVPNWIVGIGAFLGYKLLSEKFAAGGRR